MDGPLAQFRQSLDAGLQTLGELHETLLREREALSGRDVAALESITREKAEQLERVEQQARERGEWLSRNGLPADSAALRERLAALDGPSGELAQRWMALGDALEQVHRENQVNGRIIARSRQTLGQLVSILRGHSGAAQLYDRSGDKRSLGPSGEIARA